MRTTKKLIGVASRLLIGVAVLASAGCKEDEPDASGPEAISSAEWPATETTDGGSFEVTVDPEPEKIVLYKHFALDVKVGAKDGESSGIAIVADADMPEHRHGMNTKPEVSEIEAGHFRVEGMLFHMAGQWVITVDVTRGEKTESAEFPVYME